jgi:hypothetical protein
MRDDDERQSNECTKAKQHSFAGIIPFGTHVLMEQCSTIGSSSTIMVPSIDGGHHQLQRQPRE